jgi:hypothetical protein
MNFEFLIIIIVSGISAVLTAQIAKKLTIVQASASIGLFSALLILIIPGLCDYLRSAIPLAVYGANFIGMTSSKVIEDSKLHSTSRALLVSGGGLGTKAFVSVILVVLIQLSFVKIKNLLKHP